MIKVAQILALILPQNKLLAHREDSGIDFTKNKLVNILVSIARCGTKALKEAMSSGDDYTKDSGIDMTRSKLVNNLGTVPPSTAWTVDMFTRSSVQSNNIFIAFPASSASTSHTIFKLVHLHNNSNAKTSTHWMTFAQSQGRNDVVR